MASYTLEFQPSKKPYLPENLFWYNHESEWQRIADDRLNGNLNSAKSLIKSDVFSALSNSEAVSLETEISANKIPVGGSHNFTTSKKQNQSNKESIEVQIEVYFKDKEELLD